ncbi:MAG: hypothetical protein KJ621_20465, partial [Proteobacteria bacterium]|nr:hypothetical protein [Pseudomonadota bacterium]
LVEHLSDLVGLMNGLSAVFSVISVGCFFGLFYRLTREWTVALFAGLLILLAPSLWHVSHYGHPAIVAIALLAASLLALDKLLVERSRPPGSWLWGLIFLTLAFAAVALRLDIVLAFGAYYGLLLYRRKLTVGNFVRLTAAVLLMAVGIVGLRWQVFGAVFPAEAVDKMGWYLDPLHLQGGRVLAKTLFKNLVFWAVAANIMVAGLAALGALGLLFRGQWRMVLFLLAWILPWALFLPFRAIDAHRLVAPSLPALCFMAAFFVSLYFRRRKGIALAVVLILAQVAAVVSYQGLVRHYPFKIRFDGRALASVPLGFPPVDYVYRQKYLDRMHDVAREVTATRKGTVLIIDGKGSEMFYDWYLRRQRKIAWELPIHCQGVSMVVIQTETNAFWTVNVAYEIFSRDPIHRALRCIRQAYNSWPVVSDRTDLKVHVAPYWTEYPYRPKGLFLSQDQIRRLLADERRKVAKVNGRIGPSPAPPAGRR